MRPRTKAWIGLGAGVAAWDVFAEERETLSDASRDAMEANPLIVGSVITVTALHLAGKLPTWADPIHWVAELLERLRSEVCRRIDSGRQPTELSS
ncbi:MAG: hypothetical protein WBH51_01465 [Mycolicibacter algericus]|uniref:DUF7427 family protein n=1 Tax=Mycolicibacter algericus TaxID=1288388 RepID=UPI003C73D29E